MAPTQNPFPTVESIEKVTERLTELNQQSIQRAKQAHAAYLDSYEKAVNEFTDSYEKAASAGNIEWIGTVAATQADVTRQLAKAYVGAARELTV